MNRRRSFLAATLGVGVAVAAMSGCSLMPQPVETRLPPAAPSSAASSPTPPLSPSPSTSTTPGTPPSPVADPATDDVIACTPGLVVITGQERSVRLEGACDDVSVSGTAITLDATAASLRTLEIAGDRIRVEVGAADTVTVQGNDGAVSVAASVTRVSLSGDRTTVTSTGDIASVEVRGQDNTVHADGAVSDVVLEGRGNSIS